MSANNNKLTLPTDSKARKEYPILSGCLKYFPAALAGIARISKEGNDKHNPGLPLHHARGLSMDHGDCVIRHLIDTEDLLAALDRADKGTEALQRQILTEASQMAWRALAYSQMLHEKFGAPLAPGADERLLRAQSNSPAARAEMGEEAETAGITFSEALKQDYGDIYAPLIRSKFEQELAKNGLYLTPEMRKLVERYSSEDHKVDHMNQIVAQDAIDEAAGIAGQLEQAVKSGFKIP